MFIGAGDGNTEFDKMADRDQSDYINVLIDGAIQAKEGKVDLSKIQIECVIVKVVKDKLPAPSAQSDKNWTTAQERMPSSNLILS
jgi:hypothetical protein